ncbi:protein O-mannosyl-transferase family [Tenacibaculum amylolyticum]|uniref:protein O-mannosyl-transferase family n=1 Tax=Tenacibaculum amylolyticum TaxID=104269 RepID=UPI0038952C14
MKRQQTIIRWSLFLFTFAIYIYNLPSGITFWDSSEFIVSNDTLQITHPAGAPFYTLISNVILGVFFFMSPAFVSNMISAFFGALTIPLLYNITHLFASKIYTKPDREIILHFAGIIAALSFAFSTSFWTAATETEVYTLSFFLLLLVVWLAFKWFITTSLKKEFQFLYLIFLILGISIGVHLINIAVVIPLAFIFTYKKFGFNLRHIITAFISGLVLFIILLNIIFQGTLKVIASFDIWAVNSLQLPVNSGALFLFISIFIALFAIIYIGYIKKLLILHSSVICIVFFLIGSSSYLTPIIRSQITTPISNVATTPNALIPYVSATQFGVDNIPLLNGSTFNAPIDTLTPLLDTKPFYKYKAKQNKYNIVNSGKHELPNYDKRFNLFFPRVYHKNAINKTGYQTWTTIKGHPIATKVNGKKVTIYKPTFSENLSFFYNYQVYWLYLRYLFQNFIGTQNNLKGDGSILRGNWISGFDFIDKNNVGDDSLIPSFYRNLNSKDVFYFLPFLMGIWGLFLLRKHKLLLYTSGLLFLLFGLGIIIYVNPVPQSIMIRERDYIFTGSFMFFSIWIGLSVIGFVKVLSFIKNETYKKVIAVLVSLLFAPAQLLVKGFDNHNRSNENFAYQLAKTYLASCPEQAILVTNTDNMTFPLWYLQEVEGYRTDIRIINYEQLVFDWYSEKLTAKMHLSKPVHLTLSDNFIDQKFNTAIPLHKITSGYFNLDKLSSFMDNPKNRLNIYKKKIYFFPTDQLLLPIATSTYLKKTLKSLSKSVQKLDTLRWDYNKQSYTKNDIILLDVIANNFNNRPICFSEIGNTKHTLGLDNFLIQRGLVSQLLPVKSLKGDNPKIIHTPISYQNLVTASSFKHQDNIDTKVTDETIAISKTIVRKNYYFLAQALIEEGKIAKAKEVLNYVIDKFPNTTIPYGEYAFALGKLYYRLKMDMEGNTICETAIQNVEETLLWMTSFDTPRPIINIRRANYLFKIYSQMVTQIQPYNSSFYTLKSKDVIAIKKRLDTWKNRNWPY